MKNKLISKVKSMISVQGAIFLLLSALVLCAFYLHIDSLFCYKSIMPADLSLIKMENGKVYAEEIKGLTDGIRSVSIKFGTYQRENEGTLTVKLKEEDRVLKQWEVATSELMDNTYYQFETSKTITIESGKRLFLELEDDFAPDTENNIAVFYAYDSESKILSANEEIDAETFSARRRTMSDRMRRGIEGKDAVSFSVQWKLVDMTLRGRYRALCIIASVLAIVLLAWLTDFRNYNWKLALIVALVLPVIIYYVDYDFLENICASLEFQSWSDDAQTVEINPSEERDFQLPDYHSAFDSIEFFVEEQPEKLAVEVIDQASGETVLSETPQRYFGDGRVLKLGALIEGEESFAPGEYTIKLKNEGSDVVRVYASEEGVLNGYVTRETFVAHHIFMLVLLIAVFSAIFICKYAVVAYDFPRLFICAAIPLTLIYLLMFAPWSPPDTRSHFLATYRISNILLGVDEDLGRQEDVDFLQNAWEKNYNPSIMSYNGVVQNLRLKCGDTSLVPMERDRRMDYYSIINFFPEGLGLALGRKLQLNIVLCLYIARIFVIIAYILICYYSILHTPIGKSIFTMVCLFPMSLMMSSAISYDTWVIAVSMAFISSILYLKKDPKHYRGWIEAMIWSFLLGAVKGGGYLIIFLPFILVLLGGDRRKAVRMACIAAAGILSITLFNYILPRTELFQFGEKGSGNLSTAFVFKHPMKYLGMTVLTYVQYLDGIAFNTGGTNLAWLEWTMPGFVITMMYFAGAFSAMYEKDEIVLDRKDYALMLAVIFIALIGTPAMLLSFTRIGGRYVNGVQGRYYIPLVPLAMLILTKRSSRFPIKKSEKKLTRELWRVFYLLSIFAVYYMIRLYLTRQ